MRLPQASGGQLVAQRHHVGFRRRARAGKHGDRIARLLARRRHRRTLRGRENLGQTASGPGHAIGAHAGGWAAHLALRILGELQLCSTRPLGGGADGAGAGGGRTLCAGGVGGDLGGEGRPKRGVLGRPHRRALQLVLARRRRGWNARAGPSAGAVAALDEPHGDAVALVQRPLRCGPGAGALGVADREAGGLEAAQRRAGGPEERVVGGRSRRGSAVVRGLWRLRRGGRRRLEPRLCGARGLRLGRPAP
mmetsp:Transcript_4840/g.18339  ORF Transcript_4840/g.18339 Transcript_4840/m.18339 type:complete len:250 (-) Transcript_4840:979-1728(-)